MVFEKFVKKKETTPVRTLPSNQFIINEIKSSISTIVQTLTKLEQRVERLEHEVSDLKRALEGYFIIQLSTVPSSLAELAKILNLKGAVLLFDSNEIERYGEIQEDYKSLMSSIDFTSILHFDKGELKLYFLKHGNKLLYIETQRTLDNYTLGLIRRFLEYV